MFSEMMYILLVEEDQSRAAVIERGLKIEFANISVELCRSGVDALSGLRAGSFDIIVLSLDLSDISGLEILELMLLERLAVPVVVYAASGNERLAADAIKSGAAEYLPLDSRLIEKLSGAIRRALWESGAESPEEIPACLSDAMPTETWRIISNTLSHEINNPLQTILGVTELVLSEQDKYGGEVCEKMAAVDESARRIKSILADLSGVDKPNLRLTPSGTIIEPGDRLIRDRE